MNVHPRNVAVLPKTNTAPPTPFAELPAKTVSVTETTPVVPAEIAPPVPIMAAFAVNVQPFTVSAPWA